MTRLLIMTSLAADAPRTYWIERAGAPPQPTDLEGARAGNHDAVIVLIDARDCTRLTLQLPARSDAHARAAAPFAVEDRLAAPIEDCHVAIGPAQDDTGTRPITVVDRARLRELISALALDGLQPTLALDEIHLMTALPAGDPPAMLALDDRVLGVAPDNTDDRIAIDRSLLNTLAEHSADPVRYFSTKAGDALNQQPAQHIDMATLLAKVDWSGAAGLTLLQGDFKPRKPWRDIWILWRRPVRIAALAILVAVGSLIADTLLLTQKLARVDRAAQTALQTAFPGARSIDHMLQRLSQMQDRSGDPFLTLASVSLSALQTSNSIRLDGLRYSSERDQLDLSLAARRFEDVQALKGQFDRLGATMTEGASRQVDGEIVSDVTIEWKRR